LEAAWWCAEITRINVFNSQTKSVFEGEAELSLASAACPLSPATSTFLHSVVSQVARRPQRAKVALNARHAADGSGAPQRDGASERGPAAGEQES
jgi:hypothetical protein